MRESTKVYIGASSVLTAFTVMCVSAICLGNASRKAQTKEETRLHLNSIMNSPAGDVQTILYVPVGVVIPTGIKVISQDNNSRYVLSGDRAAMASFVHAVYEFRMADR